jgi:hypothetical protein
MINVGLTPFTTTASALSLLLVFRTNASYGRWWEARKVGAAHPYMHPAERFVANRMNPVQ